MNKLKKSIANWKERTNDWLYDHMPVKHGLDYLWAFILSTLSALVFAFGYNCFINLQTLKGSEWVIDKFVAGGVSGLSQTLTVFLEVCGVRFTVSQEHILFSVLYFAFNVPMIILAFFGIGKRYTILTLISVAEASLFNELLTPQNVEIINQIAQYVNNNGGLLARVIFGGVTTGLSSALAFKGDFSAGGIDIIAYYIALKKRATVGKYAVAINVCTLTLFTILCCTQDGWGEFAKVGEHCARAIFSAVYLFVSGLVIDRIHTRNRKVKMQIVSNNPDLGQFIISHLPHAATMFKGIGVYTGQERYVFDIVISSYELKSAIKLVRGEDKTAFIEILPLVQVEGHFYMKPIK